MVTVPVCLEILLLSPENEEWKNTIKYVIFDEIHEIGDSNGEVWEHLLALLPCPFIGLSATIGHPEKFVHWLRNFAPNIEDVEHNERSTDLSFYICSFFGNNCNLTPVHPLQTIYSAALLERDAFNLPPMLPKQAKLMYDITKKEFENLFIKSEIKKLKPERFFQNKNFDCVPLTITRKQMAEYDSSLKKLWINIANIVSNKCNF